ncbi:MAG: bifunctional histidinol-phosphatase/imidazoleglycerol-phosphate dehydratase [Bacteroidetes bacterium HGW-Bacteroidetes-17]|jgi:imidazoleglycerol-phosphate dehydratase/histidinol-phosphatase|nr:MAG: bifunctional histidinol-phosphatase/imidazoleglycerol-phosphate dehydratase [Bacteroidetes bacterium HGW-Bacteroidetes-17]
MKKVLFIDRDGTLVIEPPIDLQLDSLEKLEFYPGVFQYLARIANELEYELVMVSNQDGLGTSSFPENTFWPAQNKIIQAFKNEGVLFAEILIDRTFSEDQSPTRKPGTAMLTHYLKGNYDLENSYVIGDRATDVQLAKNMSCKSIFLSMEANADADLITQSWEDIYRWLKEKPRTAAVIRQTAETKVEIDLNLDGIGKGSMNTGLAFFDHMLDQLARHGNFDLNIKVEGDLKVDEHHSIEDVAITLGDAFDKALGLKKGIERYGFLLPMDDSLAQVALDFGGRSWLVWNADFKREKIGDVPTEMFEHFFRSFCHNAKCNLNIKVEGTNEHHKIESIFKAFAKTLKMACSRTNHFEIPSTKGSL